MPSEVRQEIFLKKYKINELTKIHYLVLKLYTRASNSSGGRGAAGSACGLFQTYRSIEFVQ